MTNVKDKERILKAAREKWLVTYKRTPTRLSDDFQQKFGRPEGSGMMYLKSWIKKKKRKEKRWLTTRILYLTRLSTRIEGEDFPGDSVDKNPPASVGDMGLIPGLGSSHIPWSNKAHVPQLLSPLFRFWKPQLLSPHAATAEAHTPRACAPQQKMPPQWEVCTPQQRVAPTHHT